MNKLKYSYKEALEHFERTDRKMAVLLSSFGKIDFGLSTDHFESLVRAIISQQISTKAAESIFSKVEAGVGGKMEPAVLHRSSPELLRSWGLSPQKQGYIKDLSLHFTDAPEKFSRLHLLPDHEVLDALVEIKGIGKWTGQMFLIFTLGRCDVFAPDDLGLRNAMMRLYNWKTIPDKKKMERKAVKWSPYRSVASLYLWKSLSNKTA
ncbi:MAG: DNA-3-methyladenine glycosylase 2 family protein [Crocinitomicaceae bacterium]|nr:DNA-3-methyladenine glycosylase 2 family protein [Crocinitomicaceae bacterium]